MSWSKNLIYVVLICLLAFSLKPDEASFVNMTKKVNVEENFLINLAYQTIRSIQVGSAKYYDYGLFSLIMLPYPTHQIFLGVFGLWIPIPQVQLPALGLIYRDYIGNCNYRGMI